MQSNYQSEEEIFGGIAVVGMSGRFPQAENVEKFWENLCNGAGGIEFLTKEKEGSPSNNPNYVPAGGFLEGIDRFDAAFFGYTAREAQVIDPQQRIFLEEAWTALERAGYDSRQYEGRIGVFAGTGMNQYFIRHIYPNTEAVSAVGSFQSMIHNEKDYLATRVAYKLGCTGASFTVQAACSTSLTAIAMGVQSLLSYQNDMVLAGGVSLPALDKKGYMYEQGGIASPDGYCRAYDAKAAGTVPGNGVGVVVLKRLEDAIKDGDSIQAVIRGAAINNDGEQKMGFTAPSIEGQSKVIAEALALADVGAETIGFVEGHGTGTKLGDPIEVAALTKAFRMHTEKTGYCALGSVKTNIGHLDTASGAAGFIKAVLALENRVIPPSLNFQTPNPEMDFENSPFYVNSRLIPWPETLLPRRAGVSSFGLGGTNAHVILEEAPPIRESGEARPYQLILLSAKTQTALEKTADNLINTLAQNDELNLADVAYTLHAGRRSFPYRKIVVAKTTQELVQNLAENKASGADAAEKSYEGSMYPVFLFTGQGAQYVNMGRELYEQEPLYRYWVDYCCGKLTPYLHEDLRAIMYPPEGDSAVNEDKLKQTQMAQAALFVTEYALGKLLMNWGINPKAMIGHSLGEFVAAVLAEVLSLDDALLLVAKRGQLMQSMPHGEMVSVALSEDTARKYTNRNISIAAVNAPKLCVLSGTAEAIADLELKFDKEGIEYWRLQTSHAFHSAMMEPASNAFEDVVRNIALSPPKIPYVSCTTGTWITDSEATDPSYWGKHLRETVHFAEGIKTLLLNTNNIPVEVGPGHTLVSFVKQQSTLKIQAIPTMRHPKNKFDDYQVLLNAAGRLWLNGIDLNAQSFYDNQYRRRVLLPTYPFERKRYWLEEACGLEEYKRTVAATADEEADSTSQPGNDTAKNNTSSFATETEAKVAGIWISLIGEEKISTADNFFELGGHSLLGIRVMKCIRELFQIELPERTIYDFPTVSSLSGAVDDAILRKNKASHIPQADRSLPLPASWTQVRMWERERAYPGDCCTTAIGWEYRGKLDITLFEHCIKELIIRHETLRVSFYEDSGRVFQKINDPVGFKLPVVDLTNLSENEQEQKMHALAFDEERMPFDMREHKLWRVTLYLRSEDRYAFFITAHTSIMDGPSAVIFLKELGALLQVREQGNSEPLPPLPIQYADYVLWEQESWSGPNYDEYLSYWREKLGNVHITRLPTDRPRKAQGSLSAVEPFTINKSIADELKKMSRYHGCSLYTVLLAGFKIAIYNITGEKDIITETSFANRTNRDIEEVIGCFVNFVLLRASLADNPALIEVIWRVKETVSGAVAHSELPFAKVMSEMYPELYGSERHYVRGVAFTQYEKGSGIAWPNLVTERRLWARRALFDLYVFVVDYDDDGISLNVEYDTYHFYPETIRSWFSYYIRILQQMVTDPSIRLDDLPAIV